MTPQSQRDDLDAWLAEEAAVRARRGSGGGPGVATAAQLAGLTGLEQLQAMLRGELPHAQMAHTLNFLLLHVAPGEAVFQGAPGERHFNPIFSTKVPVQFPCHEFCMSTSVHAPPIFVFFLCAQVHSR